MARVTSLLLNPPPPPSSLTPPLDESPTTKKSDRVVVYLARIPGVGGEGGVDPIPIEVRIEYLPCVATFESYDGGGEDGGGGGSAAASAVRYLSKVEHHGGGGRNVRGSSLAPFFDDDDAGGGGDDDNEDESPPPVGPEGVHRERARRALTGGVTAVAVGCGIESASDLAMIRSFAMALSGGGGGGGVEGGVGPSVEMMRPGSGYDTASDETEAYRSLDARGRARVTADGTIGPGKMARFAAEVAERAVYEALGRARVNVVVVRGTDEAVEERVADGEGADDGERGGDDDETEARGGGGNADIETGIEEPPARPPLIARDHANTQFLCRYCRTVLFESSDLEDPPHCPSLHTFNDRKRNSGLGKGGMSRLGKRCESAFIASPGMGWMGEMDGAEGKFHCPGCRHKVGLWRWAGAQCSCGTWVTPAIRVPLSKVDVVLPSAASEGRAGGSILDMVVSRSTADDVVT